jgi:hypothetical protein
MQKNAHKPSYILGSQHTSENYQKAKKDTIWYLFGVKFVFGISQIEWICLTEKNAKSRHIPRHTWVLHVIYDVQNVTLTSHSVEKSRSGNRVYRGVLGFEDPTYLC